MAVNLAPPSGLLPVQGIRLGTAAAGIKRADLDDLLVIAADAPVAAAGVFTKSSFAAAPVQVCREHLRQGDIRALVVNSGNANAATGEVGLRDARDTASTLAKLLGCEAAQILPFSTGVIGVPLPMPKLRDALPRAMQSLDVDNWDRAARAIMTTDTVPKARSTEFRLGDRVCRVTGICKGAGMIKPDMATMLAYVATDAAVEKSMLSELVREIADESFNRVTVDGDTSTNDSFVALASGASGAAAISSAVDPGYALLRGALREVCVPLAQAIIRDGEGATKFVTVEVRGGATRDECLRVGYAIAESPLVKTAMFAGDPNWGRYCMAIGRAGLINLDTTRVGLWLDDVCVARGGMISADYTEAAGADVMAKSEYVVRVELGRGSAIDRVWTSDFSYDYVKINAEYRT